MALNNELTNLGIYHNTDKAFFHSFTDFYYEYFKNLKENNLNILELGINHGKSLMMLRDFFTNSTVYGIDINPNSVKDYGPRIKTFLCSQTDNNKLTELFRNIQFDIIIDDGSHMTLHQLQSLGFLFKYLKKSGLYICEDLHTSVISSFINSTTIPLNILNDYASNKLLNIPEILKEDNDYINDNIQDIVIYKRNKNAIKCYRCLTPNIKNLPQCSKCNINLSPTDLSITSIIVKK